MTNRKKIPILEHIEELRQRTLLCLLVILTLSAFAYPLTDDIINEIKEDVLGKYSRTVIVLNPMEAILVRLRLALVVGFSLSTSYILYEALKFISPGLHKKEKKLMLSVLPASALLFALGVLFGYKVLLPTMIKFLLAYATSVAAPLLRLSDTISIITYALVGMGLIFQWPLVTYVLAQAKIASPTFWSANRRYAILTVFVLAALITDPTLITQLMMAGPMLALYEVGILSAAFAWKKK